MLVYGLTALFAILFVASLFLLYANSSIWGMNPFWLLAFLLSGAGLIVMLFVGAVKTKNPIGRAVLIIIALFVALIALSVFMASSVVVCDPVHDPVHPQTPQPTDMIYDQVHKPAMP